MALLFSGEFINRPHPMKAFYLAAAHRRLTFENRFESRRYRQSDLKRLIQTVIKDECADLHRLVWSQLLSVRREKMKDSSSSRMNRRAYFSPFRRRFMTTEPSFNAVRICFTFSSSTFDIVVVLLGGCTMEIMKRRKEKRKEENATWWKPIVTNRTVRRCDVNVEDAGSLAT